MADQQLESVRALLESLGGWEGFRVVEISTEATDADVGSNVAPRLLIRLEPHGGLTKRCSRCGAPVADVHDVSERRVRDLPLFEHDVWLAFPRARLLCPRCGPTVEAVPWLDRYQRMTKRLADKIARLAQVMPIKHVANWFGISWDTVKQIDQRALETRLGPVDLTGVRVIAIDEFALHRGHRYATMVVDVPRKRVLWVGSGRDGNALAGFFDALGEAGCAQIEAVVLDMFPAYVAVLRERCPQAALVYDLFHVVARYGQEVVDRVRIDETNKLQRPSRDYRRAHAESIRRGLKRTRWLLLSNRQNLVWKDRVRLRDLLKVNRALFKVYVLKDDLKQLWRFRYPGVARRFWRAWYARAIASRVPALIRFARRLQPRVEYIINHCRYPLHTSFLEGINNKIKVLKRMAYGFRDDEYFFLKIRAAFPGIP